jgi:hypothetical protein
MKLIHQIIEGKIYYKTNIFSILIKRPSPRSYRSTRERERERERRRSPRPPPTIQQSTQRTIVYMHEPSSSKHHST